MELMQTNNLIISNNFNSKQFGEAWEEWIKDRASSTRKGYQVTIKCFLEWLYTENIQNPTRNDIMKYREWLLTPHRSRKNGKEIVFSTDTATRYFRGVKMFFSFLSDQGLYKDITKNVRSPKTKSNNVFRRDALEREDILKILSSIDRTTEQGKRDYFIILLCVTCGLRLIEVQRANIGDIETHAGQHRLYIQGKGHLEKDDYKKLEKEVWEAYKDYLKARKTIDRSAPLIASVASNAKEGGTRLSVPSLSRLIKTILLNAGYNSSRITAHSLRHTSITLDRRAGATPEEASKHARHSSITITQRYDHMLEKEEAKDERRILDYLFKTSNQKDTSARIIDLTQRLSQEKQEKALELLEALAM